MKISIITATYNSETTIRDSLESVLMQSYADWELIVKDGGSKDNTIEICNDLAEKSKDRIRVISSPDKGLYDAINMGIQLSRGEIIGILNSDDYFHRKDILEIINRIFSNSPTVEGIYGDATVVAQSDITRTVRYTRAKRFRPWMFRIGLMPPHPSFYVRKECFEKYGLYNPNYKIAADFDLMTRFMLIKKIETLYLPIPILTMRDGGMSTSLSNKRKLNREVVNSWHDNGLKQPGWFIYLKYPIRLLELILNKDRK